MKGKRKNIKNRKSKRNIGDIHLHLLNQAEVEAEVSKEKENRKVKSINNI